MGDIDGRGLQPLVQLLDLGPHLHAQLGVKVRQRLVEQEHLWIPHDRPAHGHALALATRQGARIAVKIGCQPQNSGSMIDLGTDGLFVHAAHLQGKAHIGRHGLVRVKRIVLEHHGNVTLGRRQVVHTIVADHHIAACHILKARDHAQ